MKDVTELTVADFRQHAVWRFTGRDEPTETAVRPVKHLPVTSLAGALVGCEGCLASGQKVMMMLGNLDPTNSHATEHFLTVTIFRDDGAIFHLARYNDIDADQHGPDTLASFLQMKKEEIFPISWDVRRIVAGDPAALHGKIEASPRERLTRTQLIALAAR